MSRKLLPLLSCFLLFFAQGYPAFSQNRVVTGKVIDSATNSPVPGITVRVSGTQSGTSTDAGGSFPGNPFAKSFLPARAGQRNDTDSLIIDCNMYDEGQP